MAPSPFTLYCQVKVVEAPAARLAVPPNGPVTPVTSDAPARIHGLLTVIELTLDDPPLVIVRRTSKSFPGPMTAGFGTTESAARNGVIWRTVVTGSI